MITNKEMKELAAWNRKSKARKEDGVFLIEGTKMFLEAPIDRIRKTFVSESFFKTESQKQAAGEKSPCLEKLNICGYEVVADSVFAKICDTMTPQGILCVMYPSLLQPQSLHAGTFRWRP